MLRGILERAERDESFGNARFARTLFEQSLNAQALRLGQGDVESLTLDELAVLDAGGSRRRRARARRGAAARARLVVRPRARTMTEPLNVWDYERLAPRRSSSRAPTATTRAAPATS